MLFCHIAVLFIRQISNTYISPPQHWKLITSCGLRFPLKERERERREKKKEKNRHQPNDYDIVLNMTSGVRVFSFMMNEVIFLKRFQNVCIIWACLEKQFAIVIHFPKTISNARWIMRAFYVSAFFFLLLRDLIIDQAKSKMFIARSFRGPQPISI